VASSLRTGGRLSSASDHMCMSMKSASPMTRTSYRGASDATRTAQVRSSQCGSRAGEFRPIRYCLRSCRFPRRRRSRPTRLLCCPSGRRRRRGFIFLARSTSLLYLGADPVGNGGPLLVWHPGRQSRVDLLANLGLGEVLHLDHDDRDVWGHSSRWAQPSCWSDSEVEPRPATAALGERVSVKCPSEVAKRCEKTRGCSQGRRFETVGT
jgi:hypothetical protein